MSAWICCGEICFNAAAICGSAGMTATEGVGPPGDFGCADWANTPKADSIPRPTNKPKKARQRMMRERNGPPHLIVVFPTGTRLPLTCGWRETKYNKAP